LNEGLPILTIKKVFLKGIIRELLWFISGDTNMRALLVNNVNIWNDDAERYFHELLDKHNEVDRQYNKSRKAARKR
jgi:thymidylate synthase